MEILEQLDEQVSRLLQRLDEISMENSSLADDLAKVRVLQAALEEENRNLSAKLREEELLRNEACKRVDVLLQKIQES
ncbi:MAG: cell division protein ZapB [Desulfovibrio sp.]|nr:cell division protein ZapB [Desulfovibrio sp.]